MLRKQNTVQHLCLILKNEFLIEQTLFIISMDDPSISAIVKENKMTSERIEEHKLLDEWQFDKTRLERKKVSEFLFWN